MPLVMIVRENQSDRFRCLEEAFAGESVEVIWDRRRGERRLGAAGGPEERRQGERRRQPPVSWALLDFLLAELVSEPERQ